MQKLMVSSMCLIKPDKNHNRLRCPNRRSSCSIEGNSKSRCYSFLCSFNRTANSVSIIESPVNLSQVSLSRDLYGSVLLLSQQRERAIRGREGFRHKNIRKGVVWSFTTTAQGPNVVPSLLQAVYYRDQTGSMGHQKGSFYFLNE